MHVFMDSEKEWDFRHEHPTYLIFHFLPIKRVVISTLRLKFILRVGFVGRELTSFCMVLDRQLHSEGISAFYWKLGNYRFLERLVRSLFVEIIFTGCFKTVNVGTNNVKFLEVKFLVVLSCTFCQFSLLFLKAYFFPFNNYSYIFARIKRFSKVLLPKSLMFMTNLTIFCDNTRAGTWDNSPRPFKHFVSVVFQYVGDSKPIPRLPNELLSKSKLNVDDWVHSLNLQLITSCL